MPDVQLDLAVEGLVVGEVDTPQRAGLGVALRLGRQAPGLFDVTLDEGQPGLAHLDGGRIGRARRHLRIGLRRLGVGTQLQLGVTREAEGAHLVGVLGQVSDASQQHAGAGIGRRQGQRRGDGLFCLQVGPDVAGSAPPLQVELGQERIVGRVGPGPHAALVGADEPLQLLVVDHRRMPTAPRTPVPLAGAGGGRPRQVAGPDDHSCGRGQHAETTSHGRPHPLLRVTRLHICRGVGRSTGQVTPAPWSDRKDKG